MRVLSSSGGECVRRVCAWPPPLAPPFMLDGSTLCTRRAHNLACPLLVVKNSAAAAASGEETSMLLSRLDEDAEDKEDKEE
jgi:hypothetical protein